MAHLSGNIVTIGKGEEIIASSLRERAFTDVFFGDLVIRLPAFDKKNQIIILRNSDGELVLLSCYRDVVKGDWLMVQHSPKRITRKDVSWYHMDTDDNRVLEVEGGGHVAVFFKDADVRITTNYYKKKAQFCPSPTALCRLFLGRRTLGEFLWEIRS